MRWTCGRCGQEHEGLPHDWAWDKPIYWEGPRSADDALTSDLCRWTDEAGEVSYFVRGVLTIPVVDDEDDFRYGVWSSLSERSYERVVELWEDPARVEEPPFFGWFSNSLPGYPETLNLPLDVVAQPDDLRPELVLHEGDHPLIREQRDGITLERVREIAARNIHQ